MASAQTLLSLAVAALLVAAASAALPEAFKNEGGPPFIEGPSFDIDQNTTEVSSMGLISASTYSFATLANDSTVTTVRGVYTSWECVDGQPGYYRALVEVTYIYADGEETKPELRCEYGMVDIANWENAYAQSAEECPTETDMVAKFHGERDVENSCGNPKPLVPADAAADLADSLADFVAPTPAPAA